MLSTSINGIDKGNEHAQTTIGNQLENQFHRIQCSIIIPNGMAFNTIEIPNINYAHSINTPNFLAV